IDHPQLLSDQLVDARGFDIQHIYDRLLCCERRNEHGELTEVCLRYASIKRGFCPDQELILSEIWSAAKQIVEVARFNKAAWLVYAIFRTHRAPTLSNANSPSRQPHRINNQVSWAYD